MTTLIIQRKLWILSNCLKLKSSSKWRKILISNTTLRMQSEKELTNLTKFMQTIWILIQVKASLMWRIGKEPNTHRCQNPSENKKIFLSMAWQEEPVKENQLEQLYGFTLEKVKLQSMENVTQGTSFNLKQNGWFWDHL